MLLFYIWVFLFGTIVGSFLNVIILRYNSGESIIKGPSRCFNCGKKLKWHELIPVISFFIQRGKCRKCKSKISWQYPIIEIFTGLIFLLIFNFQFSIFKTIYFWFIFSLLIIIAVYDLRHKIIPNSFVYPFNILAFLNLFRNSDLEIRNLIDWNGFLVGIIFFSFFALIWLISRGHWMGFGDAKLSLGIGWLLGISKGILTMFLAFWLGAIVSIFLMLFFRKRYNLKSSIPFGPFLILGACLSFFFGDNFLAHYNFWMIK